MSSAICFNLHQFKILLSGNGLTSIFLFSYSVFKTPLQNGIFKIWEYVW